MMYAARHSVPVALLCSGTLVQKSNFFRERRHNLMPKIITRQAGLCAQQQHSPAQTTANIKTFEHTGSAYCCVLDWAQRRGGCCVSTTESDRIVPNLRSSGYLTAPASALLYKAAGYRQWMVKQLFNGCETHTSVLSFVYLFFCYTAILTASRDRSGDSLHRKTSPAGQTRSHDQGTPVRHRAQRVTAYRPARACNLPHNPFLSHSFPVQVRPLSSFSLRVVCNAFCPLKKNREVLQPARVDVRRISRFRFTHPLLALSSFSSLVSGREASPAWL